MLLKLQSRTARLLSFRDEPTLRRFCTHCGPMFSPALLLHFPFPFTPATQQGGKRLGDETSSPLFKRCVMRRRTGTSALSALPVRLVAGKIYLSTNRKSHFLSLFFSQPSTVIKTFFHSPGSQLKMLMSAWTLVNLFHSKFPKNALNLRVSNACSCRKTRHCCLSSSLLKKLQITPP